MTERPILFSAEMVRAILDGRKTQTRRIVKPQPLNPKPTFDAGVWSDTKDPVTRYFGCHLGIVGDRLWVRETWQQGTDTEGYGCVVYKADGKALKALGQDNGEGDWCGVLGETEPMPCPIWKPSIFMPRWASRLTLEITNIRVERLQDISEEDAKAEGLYANPKYTHAELWTWDGVGGNSNNPIYAYELLWDSINGNGSWDKNPWVWAITFGLWKE